MKPLTPSERGQVRRAGAKACAEEAEKIRRIRQAATGSAAEGWAARNPLLLTKLRAHARNCGLSLERLIGQLQVRGEETAWHHDGFDEAELREVDLYPPGTGGQGRPGK